MEDALLARGYRVWVEQGRRARRWVRNVPSGPPTLRVLCVPTIEPEAARRLCEGREDFHILGVQTPGTMVQQIERLVGRARPHRRTRPTRAILAHPTLVERSLHAGGGRTRRGTALALALVTAGLSFAALRYDARSPSRSAAESSATRTSRPEVRAIDETVAPRSRSRSGRVEPVLSAVAPLDPAVLRELDDEPPPPSSAQGAGRSIVPSR